MKLIIDKYEISFSIEACNILKYHIQKKPLDPERGGIVLGRFNNNQIEILKLSTPTELDKASRTNFERHRLSAQIIINYEFFNSNRQITYLGEWHTHPEDYPSPSNVDIKMIQQQMRVNFFHTQFLLLLIQGRKKLFVSIFEKNSNDNFMHQGMNIEP